VDDFFPLRVEFLLKTDGGYPIHAGVFFHSRFVFEAETLTPTYVDLCSHTLVGPRATAMKDGGSKWTRTKWSVVIQT